MAKFNVVQKRRRAAIATQKRRVHGDESGKLRLRAQPLSISGKRKRKILKKERRDAKEAVEKGLISMEDVEMAVAGTRKDESKTSDKFPMKKSAKLRVKQLKKGKNNNKSQKSTGEVSVDVMME